MDMFLKIGVLFFFFFSSRRRHTRCSRDWSSDVCYSDLRLGVRAERSRPASFPSLDSLPCLLRTATAPGQGGALREVDDREEVFAPFSKRRSEERRVGKECRTRWSQYH